MPQPSLYKRVSSPGCILTLPNAQPLTLLHFFLCLDGPFVFRSRWTCSAAAALGLRPHRYVMPKLMLFECQVYEYLYDPWISVTLPFKNPWTARFDEQSSAGTRGRSPATVPSLSVADIDVVSPCALDIYVTFHVISVSRSWPRSCIGNHNVCLIHVASRLIKKVPFASDYGSIGQRCRLLSEPIRSHRQPCHLTAQCTGIWSRGRGFSRRHFVSCLSVRVCNVDG